MEDSMDSTIQLLWTSMELMHALIDFLALCIVVTNSIVDTCI
jgi:hypothetical protein